MIFAGIDAGSRTIKVALFDAERRQLAACAMCDQGVEQQALARALFDRTLKEQGLRPDQIGAIVATGYGRHAVLFAGATITEITCHAVGVRHLIPHVRTVVEIGGQDSKLIHLNPNGSVRDFSMNDRCAAGTGRFLEVVAARLEVDLDELGAMTRQSRKPAAISSTCVVFAETEIIGLMASGAALADIAAGVQSAIATRVRAMAGRDLLPPIVFAGGVARVPGMLGALQSALGRPVEAAPDPQMTGALGAAILAVRRQAAQPFPAS